MKDAVNGTEFDVEMDLRVEIEPHKMDTLTLGRRQSRSRSRSLFNNRSKSTPNIKNTAAQTLQPATSCQNEDAENDDNVQVDSDDNCQSSSCGTSVRQALVGRFQVRYI